MNFRVVIERCKREPGRYGNIFSDHRQDDNASISRIGNTLLLVR